MTQWFLAGYDAGHDSGYTEGQLAGYRDGYQAGVEEATQTVSEALDAQHRDAQTEMSRALVSQVISRGSYAERAEQRGQPERAKRQRQIVAERGISG